MYTQNYRIHIFYSFEHLLNSLYRISHINNNNRCSMDHLHHHFNCKSILKRKSLEIPTEDGPAPAVINKPAEDPLPQSSFKHFNLKSYRQGILKKHSASFDDESIQKPILKNRCQSCDDESIININEPHSILKRKTIEQCENYSEPSHGILKKRELIVNQQQPENNHHDNQNNKMLDDDIRPILKQKKYESDSADENSSYPRPILKKKSLDSSPDDKKPILKSSRSNSPAKCASSKRLSVAQRVSNFESSIQPNCNIYKKPVKDSIRTSRDRSRFHTQPVTPSEIDAIKKYVYNN